MFQDRFKSAYEALKRDVFFDSSTDGVWATALLLKCPDFIRKWILNPLVYMLTSDIPPGKK